MNIVVFSQEGIHVRPDSTWERENKDLYATDGTTAYDFRPVVLAKMSRAGKCIGEKFVDRYFESVGFGLLLSPSEQTGISTAECYDSTSRLAFPYFNKVVLNDDFANEFSIKDGDTTVFETTTSAATLKALERAICKTSQVMSLKVGDLVCIPLQERRTLASDTISAKFCENDILDFKIIY